MNTRYRIVFIIAFLLLALSVSLSVVNYSITLASTQKQLKNSSLPLSTDNIYTEIQKHIIQPDLVASMMAQDTFLKDWLINREEDGKSIAEYLDSIKNRYGMFTTFLASERTRNYYTSKGFIEKMDEKNPTNNWYFSFKQFPDSHEINLDYNEHIDNSMIMFINHKIFDSNYHMIGATGIGLKISYVDEMLKRFRIDYKFNVFFVNKNGDNVLYERGINKLKNLKDNTEIYSFEDQILAKENNLIRYSKDGEEYLVSSKFVPELDLHLLVEAKISDFTHDVIHTFYLNLLLSLIISIIIVIIILILIKRYNSKLENLANNDELTGLPNRRIFDDKLKQVILLNDRKLLDVSVLFFDIDDFKKINDSFGHNVGDEVLKRIAVIMKENVRESDLFARWGGEEFIFAFIDSSLENSEIIAEKLRKSIESDKELHALTNYNVTCSFGLTSLKQKDTLESVLKRVDKALYEAKGSGKNRVIIS